MEQLLPVVLAAVAQVLLLQPHLVLPAELLILEAVAAELAYKAAALEL
jgi:hypothetical protein